MNKYIYTCLFSLIIRQGKIVSAIYDETDCNLTKLRSTSQLSIVSTSRLCPSTIRQRYIPKIHVEIYISGQS